jgi:hypothetical protein
MKTNEQTFASRDGPKLFYRARPTIIFRPEVSRALQKFISRHQSMASPMNR